MGRKAKFKNGRPPHQPTEATRAIVRTLAASGVSDYEIAKKLGIALNTLKKHYSEDLDGGWVDGMYDASLVIMTAMKSKDVDKSMEAAKFFLSRRGRGLWSEQKNIEVSGPGGGAIPIAPIDLDAIDYEELEAAYEILAPALLTGPVAEAELEDDNGDTDAA